MKLALENVPGMFKMLDLRCCEEVWHECEKKKLLKMDIIHNIV